MYEPNNMMKPEPKNARYNATFDTYSALKPSTANATKPDNQSKNIKNSLSKICSLRFLISTGIRANKASIQNIFFGKANFCLTNVFPNHYRRLRHSPF
jgi:hypothetical protein